MLKNNTRQNLYIITDFLIKVTLFRDDVNIIPKLNHLFREKRQEDIYQLQFPSAFKDDMLPKYGRMPIENTKIELRKQSDKFLGKSLNTQISE